MSSQLDYRKKKKVPMPKRILVTGGAGFLGCNLVKSLLRDGFEVTAFDACLRSGSEKNVDWLHRNRNSSRLRFVRDDIRNLAAVQNAAAEADVIFHLAG